MTETRLSAVELILILTSLCEYQDRERFLAGCETEETEEITRIIGKLSDI